MKWLKSTNDLFPPAVVYNTNLHNLMLRAKEPATVFRRSNGYKKQYYLSVLDSQSDGLS